MRSTAGRWAWLVLLIPALTGSRLLAQDSSTAGAFWPRLAVRYQWPSRLSQTLYAQVKNEQANLSRQLGVGTDLSYQAKAISRPHLVNVDPSKEHTYVVGVGFEYLDTRDDSSPKYEDRLKVEATGRHRPTSWLLIEDRNRVEFRWVDRAYSSRYRNRVSAEVDLHLGTLRYTPYTAAEFFYSWASDSWNEQQYSIGVQWPYRGAWILDTYYLRQNCTTCSPRHLNVGGLSLSYFFGAQR